MKKITSEHLSSRLAKYGAFSAAILGAANASGQIVYTDIADETVDALNTRVAIDINDDGTGDYLFGTADAAPNFAFMFPVASSMAPNYNSNAIVGFAGAVYSSFYYPSNLALGATIDGTNPVFTSNRGDFNYDSCAYSSSQFCDGMDGYVGLHFQVAGNTHYGWVRIQVAADASSIIIKDYAYNSTPDAPIEAGQTLGVEESTINNVRIVTIDNSISLYNLPQNTNYKLYSTSGQSILNGSTDGDTHVIEANTMASGIYLLELSDPNSNSVIRKKIVL